MKYVNKEYGFAGRPPYFKDFYEEKYRGATVGAENYPATPIVGVGLQPKTPNGAMLVGEKGTMWGVRVSYQKGNKWYDSQDFLNDVGRLYTGSANGAFSYFAHGNLTATWVKYAQNSLVLSLSAVSYSAVRVIIYPVEPCEANLKANESGLKASSPYYAVLKGKTSINEEGCVFRGRYDVFAKNDDVKSREYFSATFYNKPTHVLSDEKTRGAVYEFDINNADNARILLFLEVGGKEILNSEKPSTEELIAGISTAEIEFSNANPKGTGSLACAVEDVLNSISWHKVYNPYFLATAFFSTRDVDGYFSFKGEEINCSAIVASYLSDLDSASRVLEYSYQDRLFGVLTTWLIYSRSRDLRWLKEVFSNLVRENKPDDGLVVSNWKNKNEVSYKMDMSPLKESLSQENMYSLDMSCIKLLNMDLLERMAVLLSDESAGSYAKARSSLKDKINEKLFNSKLGIYMNRFVDGDFATSCGATSFYPLIAGAVDDTEKLDRILRYLTESRKFGGEWGIPSLAKDHPEYGVKYRNHQTGEAYPPFSNYRGEIIPYINYLIYLGLVRYGVSDIASDIAIKSVALYNKAKREKNAVYDRYLPNGRVASWATKNSILGNLLAITGMSELLDVEYFRSDLKPSIRFGTTRRGEHSLQNVNLFGASYSVIVKEKQTLLTVDGAEKFIGEGGRFEVRHYVDCPNGCEFIINADGNVLITLSLPIFYKTNTENKIVFAVEKGRRHVKVEGETVTVESII